MSIEHLSVQLVSSLEKILITDLPVAHPVLKRQSVLKGETLDFQLAVRDDSPAVTWDNRRFTVEVTGVPAECVCREVVSLYVDMPCYPHETAKGTPYYLESETGTYPDVLEPLDAGNRFRAIPGKTTGLWFTCRPEQAGEYTLTVTVTELATGAQTAVSFALTVVDAALPKQTLLFTQWFHCDCLATYYHVPVFSERHWEIIGNFMQCAADNGINTILTPVLTPPLDTEVGGERPTVQLVAVKQEGESYSFDFSLLECWIALAHKCGVTHFEISHLFSQWGAEFAPKVVAEVDGELKRIFGWDTPGTGDAYANFLNQLLPQLVACLRQQGVLENCLFHISDEPSGDHLAGYMKAKDIVASHLQGCTIVDALSEVEFYKSGAVEVPVPSTDHIGAFLKEDIPQRWAYYCCGQWDKVGNRFMAYPSFRNRILGVQLYKFNIVGFLQWGYNFYYAQFSRRLINPYTCQSGDHWVPAGDTFSVYPAPDGTPLESLRLDVFREAIEDVAALTLCEQLVGRETVVALIDELAGQPLTFADYPDNAAYILTLRERVNDLIAQHS